MSPVSATTSEYFLRDSRCVVMAQLSGAQLDMTIPVALTIPGRGRRRYDTVCHSTLIRNNDRSMEAPRLVRTIYAVRTGAFAYCFLALGLLAWERAAPALAWGLLAAQFLLYPHLLYLRLRYAARPRQAEFNNLFVDSTLFGTWCAYFGFEPLVTLGLVAGTMLNATVNRGIGGGLLSLGF